MLQKLELISLSCLGLLIIVVLAVAGIDMYEEMKRGPRWKSRLIAAGLCILATLGIYNCSEAREAKTTSAVNRLTPDMIAQNNKSLAQNPTWGKIAKAWNEAQDTVSGKKGDYPFTQSQKNAMLDSLSTSQKDMGKLVSQGLISDAEGKLAKIELAYLEDEVRCMRPKEQMTATCYTPAPVQIKDHLERITLRLPLLEKIAQGKTVHPEVISRALATMEMDLSEMKNEKGSAPATERADADKLIKQAEKDIAKVKAKLGKTGQEK